MREFSGSSNHIKAAADVLAAGGLVAFPTETVYGLGADATQAAAVQRIYTAKGRPRFNPLIVHVCTPQMAAEYADICPLAKRLMEAFWPGPLTLVLPHKKGSSLAAEVGAGLPDVAIRMPDSDIALNLIKALGKPIAAPSANPSGRISPTQATHVRESLSGQIDGLIADAPAKIGLESTIVKLNPTAQILRPGSITQEDLHPFIAGDVIPPSPAPKRINAPGQMLSHYAPHQPMRLNAVVPRAGETHLGFGSIEGDVNLSKAGDLRQAASALFAALHELDQRGKPIAVAPIPHTGIGIAINDRLHRAAAPRD